MGDVYRVFGLPVATSREVTAVLPLELCAAVRPPGRLLLLGQVPCLESFRSLPPGTRLVLRWGEPDRDDA